MDERKYNLIATAYEIATLDHMPPDDVMELLMEQSMERALELLLLIRRNDRPVRSPANFIRRAIQEGWRTYTTAQTVDRRLQNREAAFYQARGYNGPQARQKALENQTEGYTWPQR